MYKMNKSIDVLDALADAAALAEEEHGRPTPQSRAAAKRYQALVNDKLAEMRRAELARNVIAKVERRPIRESLLALPREALLAVLDALKQTTPTLGFAHRDLTEVTDDDLRTMIEDAEWSMGKVS